MLHLVAHVEFVDIKPLLAGNHGFRLPDLQHFQRKLVLDELSRIVGTVRNKIVLQSLVPHADLVLELVDLLLRGLSLVFVLPEQLDRSHGLVDDLQRELGLLVTLTSEVVHDVQLLVVALLQLPDRLVQDLVVLDQLEVNRALCLVFLVLALLLRLQELLFQLFIFLSLLFQILVKFF